MQRLIEQPVGDGDVFEGPVYVGRVHYRLAVYQHFSEEDGDESVPAHPEVEGRITTIDHLDLADPHWKSPELTLHLADGRALDFSVTSESGAIRATGRGFRQRQGTASGDVERSSR
jgi:hypothetical protein